MTIRKPKQIAQDEPRVARPNAVNKATVQDLLKAGVAKCEDAQKDVSGPTRVELCFDVALFCGLAVFEAEGLRVGSETGHHKLILEGLAGALGYSEGIHDRLDAMRRLRSSKYTGFTSVAAADLKQRLAWQGDASKIQLNGSPPNIRRCCDMTVVERR
ncbi:MAG: hypothetical protein JWQ11_928 [Rhizobacter sp.]|nr:hypothetical protein [Rhizobacter sp.]